MHLLLFRLVFAVSWLAVFSIHNPDFPRPELNLPEYGTEIVSCRNKESHRCCMDAYSIWTSILEIPMGQPNVTSAFIQRTDHDPNIAKIICIDARDSSVYADIPEEESIAGAWYMRCTPPMRLRTAQETEPSQHEIRQFFPLKAWCEAPNADLIASVIVQVVKKAVLCHDSTAFASSSTSGTMYNIDFTLFPDVEAVEETTLPPTESFAMSMRELGRIRRHPRVYPLTEPDLEMVSRTNFGVMSDMAWDEQIARLARGGPPN